MLKRKNYTCNDLDLLVEEFRPLRLELLCAVDEEGISPMAALEYFKAITYFEQAYISLKQASYCQSRML